MQLAWSVPLLFMCCVSVTKLKLQAKEKITEAATEEARLFAPLEQVQHVHTHVQSPEPAACSTIK